MNFDYANEKFIMVSYSHKDAEVVCSDIDALRKLGVPVWYDDQMEVGDNWKHEAKFYIDNPNCIGVVFYVSKWSFASDACENERIWYKQKAEPKFYLGVHIGGKSITDIMGEVYMTEELRGLISGEKCRTNLELFNEEKLYCSRAENGEDAGVVQKIYEQAVKYDIVHKFFSDMEKGSLNSKAYIAETTYKLKLGEFINLRDTRNIVSIVGEANNKRGDGVIIYEGSKYPVRSLSWVLLDETPETITLILEDVLCKRYGGLLLTDWLNTEFIDIAFSDEIRDIVRNKIDLVTAEELNGKLSKIPEAEFNDKYVEWWIVDPSPDGDGRQQVAYGENIWSYGWIASRRKCYVRPVLRLKKDEYNLILQKLNCGTKEGI